jgi:nucleoside-diphosphate-sugar epimerase
VSVAPVLITGASGRLGRAIQRVAAGDVDVVALDSSTVDITDATTLSAAVGLVGPCAIIHLASIVGGACEADPERAEAVNVDGSANVIAAAREHSVSRLVFASTSSVYGDQRRRPVSESDSTAPSGVYASTKRRAEQLLEETAGPVTVDALRVFNIYGPEMPDSLVARLQAATLDAPARLSGLDPFVRDYVHVDDVARAFLAAAGSTATGFRILNVGSGIPRSNRDLLDALPEARRSLVVVGRDIESYSCADITAIARELEWRPTVAWPPSFEQH